MWTIKIESRCEGKQHPNINGIQTGEVILYEAKYIKYRAYLMKGIEYKKWFENFLSRSSSCTLLSGDNIPGSSPDEGQEDIIFYYLEFIAVEQPCDTSSYLCVIHHCNVNIINENGNVVDHFII